MARASSKTLHAAARFRGARGRIRGTQRGKLTAAMRLGDFGKYFHQIGQAGAARLGFEASRGLCRDLSYHNAAALWLYRRVEMGYHAASRRHALAAFGADTALIWGSRSGAGRWENGQQEDLSMDHRLVSAPARPAACAFAVAAATTMLTALIGSAAFGQAPPATPAPAAPKAAPKAAPAQKPAEAPVPHAQQPQAQAWPPGPGTPPQAAPGGQNPVCARLEGQLVCRTPAFHAAGSADNSPFAQSHGRADSGMG